MKRVFCLLAFICAIFVHGLHIPSVRIHQRCPRSTECRSMITRLESESNDETSKMSQQRQKCQISIWRDVSQYCSGISKRQRIAALAVSLIFSNVILVLPESAKASAPVMALPKAEGRDPASEAIMEYDRRQIARNQKELNDMAIEARKVEAEQGEAARIKFENDYKDRQQKFADERAAGLIALKRQLLDQGICPFTDLEGQRQTILYSRGVDLGKVPGTQFFLEKEFEAKNPKRSMAFKKAIHRKIIASMVQDMKNRGIDPLDYFERHQDQTEAILDLPVERAAALVRQYEANLETYGQILPPKEGELSVKQKLAAAAVAVDSDPVAKKAEEQRIKQQEQRLKKEQSVLDKQLKEKEKATKARLAAEAKAAKLAAKELEKKAQAEALKQIKDAEKEFQEKVTTAVTAAAAAAAASSVNSAGISSSLQDTVSSIVEKIEVHENIDTESTNAMITKMGDESTEKMSTVTIFGKEVSVGVASGSAFVAIAGGGVAFKLYRDKTIKDEEERQRQLRLLMGGMTMKDKPEKIIPAPAPALEEIDMDLFDLPPSPSIKKSPSKTPAPVPSTPIPSSPSPALSDSPTSATVKKKRLGLKSVFGKKKNERERDLMALVGSDADAPEFTITLAKILTFGAPGRFPSVLGLPGDMPMDGFQLDEAKKILIESQTNAGLSLVDSAEIFANVVNCMLIDIVDLASASLKEKDEKITVDAINVVVDFMNHAASLYDSIADGVTITPVTYGGDLSKAKLEQMYSAYAVSGMMNMASMTDDFDNRVAMLQDVFQINEKKAEGLMMKAMQKNMMKMIKDGEGMEGMEEMLKGMGGLDGMMPPGMGTGAGGLMDGDGPSPEQLKEMLTALKQMKDSGSIPPGEFQKVKEQFNDAFGSTIDDVVKEANANNEELSQTDKELLELMKSIMKD